MYFKVVVWGFQILSQRTYSVWPHVLVRPSWLLFWEPRAAQLFRDFSFLFWRARLDIFTRSRLG